MKPPYTRFEFRQHSIYVARLDAVTGGWDYQWGRLAKNAYFCVLYHIYTEKSVHHFGTKN